MVQSYCVPRWRTIVEDGGATPDLDQHVDLLVMLTVQGFGRDDSKRLDKSADETAPKVAFSTSRAFAAAFLNALPPCELASVFVARILQAAAATKKSLEKKNELDRATQFTGSRAHLENVRVWQMASMAAARMSGSESPALLDDICTSLITLLDSLHLPSITIYIENFLVTFCWRHPQCIQRLLLSKETGLSNYWFRTAHYRMLLGTALVLVNRSLVSDSVAEELVRAVLPILNAVQHPVRYRAVFCCVHWSQNVQLMNRLGQDTRTCVQLAADFYAACGDLSRKILKAEEDWLECYVRHEPSLELLFLAIPCKCREILAECFVPDVLTQALNSFDCSVPEGSENPHSSTDGLALSAQRRHQNVQAAEMARDLRLENGGVMDFQVKRIPWHMLKIDEDLSREAVIESSRRLPMVVCASLLDRAPNIGGLTRTCEVFGLKRIVIPDLAVTRSKEYLNVSVTAERWIRSTVVAPTQLAAWLMEMKGEGYSLVGLEQSRDSVSIVDFQFPRKCVLVLGNELQGMPATFLSMLDHVVEIPQAGTIRSLNVHVAASVMISTYVMQQLRNSNLP